MIRQAPAAFRGSLLELYRDHMEAILPSPADVGIFHDCMSKYCQEEEPIFPVRQVTGAERRLVLRTDDGTKIAPADNSPAWVTHALLMEHRLRSCDAFRSAMRQMPAHMFDIKKTVGRTVNDAGWYVAHVFPAKNRDTNFRQWSRKEVERRFYLTLHPCNLFFVPGTRNFQLGEDAKVIAFMKNRYAVRYGPIWDDFLRLVGQQHQSADALTVDYSNLKIDCSVPAPQPIQLESRTLSKAPVQYCASRLTFKRAVIEPLSDEETFEVLTPFGKYRFRKRDFYATFPNIPLTYSYREIGEYHGAKLHLQAERFKVHD